MSKPVSNSVGKIATQLGKEAREAAKDQVGAVGVWLSRLHKGERSWATHHAVLSASADNAIRVAQGLYEAVHDVRKLK
jgi:hypothetical protein